MANKSISISSVTCTNAGKYGVRCAATVLAIIVGILSLVTAAAAAPQSAVVYQPATGRNNELFIPATKARIVLQGTEKMSNAIIGDLDADGLEDDLVYTDRVNGGLGFYEIPGDGRWRPERDHAISTPKDAVPLTVLRTGGIGSPSVLIYNSASAGGTFALHASGTLTKITRMDRAYALDIRGTGFKGDLVWWTSGVGIRWREGYNGREYPNPWNDVNLIPLGGGKIIANQPTRVIAFYAKGMNGIFVCDRYWAWSSIGGTAWTWCTNPGATMFGDVDGDGLTELLYSKSTADALQCYNVPNASWSWDNSGVITESSIIPGWGLRGIATVDVSVTPGPQPEPDPEPVQVSSIGQLANLADGTLVQVAPKPRTKLVREIGSDSRVTTTGYYIQETDRSAGIRVMGQTQAAEGQYVGVKGTLGTLNGERVINAVEQIPDSNKYVITPLAATIDSLYTAPMTGLLVQASGSIGGGDVKAGWFTITSGNRSVKVYCPDISITSGNVKVTGCAGAEKNTNGTVVPVLRVETSTGGGVTSEGGNQPPTPPPTPNTNYSVWTRSGMDKVFKTDAAQTLQAAKISAARHENEPFQIVLRADKSQLTSVTVTASDLTSPGGGRITASNISIYLQHYVYLPAHSKDYPDALPPYRGAFNMTQGQTQPLWINVYVPKNTAPGDYTGTITISTSNAGNATVPVQLHVYNFTLPDDPKCTTAFALRDSEIYAQHKVAPNSSEAVALFKKYFEFVLSRNVSPFGLPYGVNIFNDEGAKYLTDPRLTSITMPYSSDRNQMSSIISRFDSLGALKKGFIYGYDEPYLMDHINRVRDIANYVHSINRNARVAVVFSDDVVATSEPRWTSGTNYSAGQIVYHYEHRILYWKNYLYKCKVAHRADSTNEPTSGPNWSQYWERVSIPRLLTGYADVWCCGVAFWDIYGPELVERANAGEEVWSYITMMKDGVQSNYFVDYASIFTRIIPWQNYFYQSKGFLYWCLDYWSETPDPWKDIDTGQKSVPTGRLYGEGSLIYPGYQIGIDGPVSSIRLEVLRDGLDDYQYLWLLEQKLGRAGVMPYVNKLVSSWRAFSKDNTQLASVRDEIARRIEN